MSSGLYLVILVGHGRRKEKMKADIRQAIRWNERVVGSRMIRKTFLNPIIGDLLQLLEIRELRFLTSVVVVMLLVLVHLESPTGLTLILQLLMGQANIITIGFQHLVILIIQLLMGRANIIIIGFQHLDLATVVTIGGGGIMIGSRNCRSCSVFGWECLKKVWKLVLVQNSGKLVTGAY